MDDNGDVMSEFGARVKTTWVALGIMKHGWLFNIMKSNIPLCLKWKAYNQCVLPPCTYGAET